MENGGFPRIPFAVPFPGQHQALLGITGRFSFEYPVWSPHETFPHFGPQAGLKLSVKANGKATELTQFSSLGIYKKQHFKTLKFT